MNKVFIDVTITHFVAGQGVQYTKDIGTCWIYAEDFQNPVEVRKAIDAYCETWAENTVCYDANEQDYIIEFWHDGERVGKALLSDYAEHFAKPGRKTRCVIMLMSRTIS